MKKMAIILLSGGLDSATVLGMAINEGYKCNCLIFDYGQKSKWETGAAKSLAEYYKCNYYLINIQMPWGGSALTDEDIDIPNNRRNEIGADIPVTYVPARNILFLSYALSFAEASAAEYIFIGAHSQDYSGYPDCREEFFNAYQDVIYKGTRAGTKGEKILVKTPLIKMTKKEIILKGNSIGVPYNLTRSCYSDNRNPCGKCDACILRAKGFKEAALNDPAL